MCSSFCIVSGSTNDENARKHLQHTKMAQEKVLLLESIGLSEQKAKETLKNSQLTSTLEEIITQVQQNGQ